MEVIGTLRNALNSFVSVVLESQVVEGIYATDNLCLAVTIATNCRIGKTVRGKTNNVTVHW